MNRKPARPITKEDIRTYENDGVVCLRGMFDDDWCQHLCFEDLMKDPIGSVRRIYAHCGETPSELHVRRMEAWMQQRGRHSEGRHSYDPKDFGWTYDELAEEFSGYRSRYGIERE